MKLVVYIVLIGLVFLAPVERLDVAKLEPIEAVALDASEGVVILKTDSGRQGRGATVSDALKDLKQNTPAVIYLDTARYLLISKRARLLEDEIKTFLKPRVKVARYFGGDVKQELEYLQAHMDSAKPLV